MAGALWLAGVAPDATPRSWCDAGPRHGSHCAEVARGEVAALLFGGRLDLNRADAASLEVLPGIGPARAAAIVAERCRAPLGSVADVERVHGIGPAIRRGLEPRARVGPATAAERCATAAGGDRPAPGGDGRRSAAPQVD